MDAYGLTPEVISLIGAFAAVLGLALGVGSVTAIFGYMHSKFIDL